MSKGRRRNYSDSEFDQLQRLKHENQQLKRDVSRLQRLVARGNFQSIKDSIDAKENKKSDAPKKVDDSWKCFECGKGILKLHLLEIRNGVKYYRKCEVCDHRTRLKDYTDDVKK